MAQLHLAAAETGDERPAGAWHAEWWAIRLLARRTVVAASQATELLAGLRVDADRMRATAAAAPPSCWPRHVRWPSSRGSRRTAPMDPAAYLGAADLLVAAVLERARTYLEGAR